jgi:hypothetical protein
MSTFRKITLHGHKSPDAEITVLVDNKNINIGSEDLFSFNTSTRLHGSSDVVIDVTKGNIVLTNCTVTYPAIFNNTVAGTITFIQPIEEPIALIEDQQIKTLPFKIQVGPGEKLAYKHLMFNGPTRYNILIEDIDLVPGINIFIGNILKRRYIKNVIKHVGEYDYIYLPNNSRSPEDLEKLKFFVLEKFSL